MMLLFVRFAKKKIDFFRGSENNLIKRVADAAKHKKIEHIISLLLIILCGHKDLKKTDKNLFNWKI